MQAGSFGVDLRKMRGMIIRGANSRDMQREKKFIEPMDAKMTPVFPYGKPANVQCAPGANRGDHEFLLMRMEKGFAARWRNTRAQDAGKAEEKLGIQDRGFAFIHAAPLSPADEMQARPARKNQNSAGRSLAISRTRGKRIMTPFLRQKPKQRRGG